MALKPDRDPLTWDISRFWGDIRGITTSTKDELKLVITGVPQAIDSRGGSPKPS